MISDSNDYLEKNFPSQPIWMLANPELRAKKCKGEGDWTKETMAEAVAELYVPSQTQIALVWPDLFDRRELAKHPEFVKHNDDDDDGVLTPCPYCKSNCFVEFDCWNVEKKKERPRVTFHPDATLTPMASPIYSCSAPDCAGAPPKLKKDGSYSNPRYDPTVEKTKKHTFRIWTKAVFSQYPQDVRDRYTDSFGGIGVNDDGTTFADPKLSLDILDDRNNFASIAEHLEKQFERSKEIARKSYIAFVEKEKPGKRRRVGQSGDRPGWEYQIKSQRPSNSFSTSFLNVNNILIEKQGKLLSCSCFISILALFPLFGGLVVGISNDQYAVRKGLQIMRVISPTKRVSLSNFEAATRVAALCI